jgi:serine/threonine-protein kinase
VAIKVLPAEVSGIPIGSRAKQEARLLASLNHPTSPPSTVSEESDGKPFLVLELVEGEDITERLKRGVIPADEAIAIAKQIAEGARGSAREGHRPPRPEAGEHQGHSGREGQGSGLRPRQGDGLATGRAAVRAATSHDPQPSPTGTAAGLILGTAAYHIARQARGRPVDKRADIWAFGVVLYEMLTGQRLFAGDTVGDVLASVAPAGDRLGEPCRHRFRRSCGGCSVAVSSATEEPPSRHRRRADHDRRDRGREET